MYGNGILGGRVCNSCVMEDPYVVLVLRLSRVHSGGNGWVVILVELETCTVSAFGSFCQEKSASYRTSRASMIRLPVPRNAVDKIMCLQCKK